jgi:hypothetical protein
MPEAVSPFNNALAYFILDGTMPYYYVFVPVQQ